MNFPSPTIFKKVDIYQQLKLLENDKPVWKAEKIVLEWAVGPDHQHTGYYISEGTISDLIVKHINSHALSNKDRDDLASLAGSTSIVNSALANHGFADWKAEGNTIRINKDGFLAGAVIKDIQNMPQKIGYYILSEVWWFMLGSIALGYILGHANIIGVLLKFFSKLK